MAKRRKKAPAKKNPSTRRRRRRAASVTMSNPRRRARAQKRNPHYSRRRTSRRNPKNPYVNAVIGLALGTVAYVGINLAAIKLSDAGDFDGMNMKRRIGAAVGAAAALYFAPKYPAMAVGALAGCGLAGFGNELTIEAGALLGPKTPPALPPKTGAVDIGRYLEGDRERGMGAVDLPRLGYMLEGDRGGIPDMSGVHDPYFETGF